jgi:hypothetical protein
MMMNKVRNGHSTQVVRSHLHPRYSPIALQLSPTLCLKVCSCTICMSAKGRHFLSRFTVAHPNTFTQNNVNVFDNHMHYPCEM